MVMHIQQPLNRLQPKSEKVWGNFHSLMSSFACTVGFCFYTRLVSSERDSPSRAAALKWRTARKVENKISFDVLCAASVSCGCNSNCTKDIVSVAFRRLLKELN